MSQTKKKYSGFTLIEVLVFLGMLIVILSISFSFLLITFSGSSKTEALKEVKQNGDFALSVMEKFVLSAKEVECSADNLSLTLTMLDGSRPVFSCSGGQISSNSSVLTSNNVTVLNCAFICTAVQGIPAMVGIGYSVEMADNASLRIAEKASLSFSTKVIVRNQR